MLRFFGLAIVITCAAVGVSAQTSNSVRKHHGEDKTATLRVEKATPETDESVIAHTAYSYSLDEYKPGVVRVGPRTTYLKEGLSTDEVVRFLGKPLTISERVEKNTTITIYEFERGEGRRLIAEFENGRLARSHTEVRSNDARADR